jgi:methylmalonyl-CoA mutase cobalamin-binding domain/chain
VLVGGIVPEDERAPLIEAGVKGIFGPGTSRTLVVDQVVQAAGEARRLRNASFWENAP